MYLLYVRVIVWALLGMLALIVLPIAVVLFVGLIRRLQIARTRRGLQRMGFVGSVSDAPLTRPLWPLLVAGLIGSVALIVATTVLPGPPAGRILASTDGSTFQSAPTQAPAVSPPTNPGSQHTEAPSKQPPTTHVTGPTATSPPATSVSSPAETGGGAGAPSTVTARPTSTTVIQLRWAPVTGATRYDVDRSTDTVTWDHVVSTVAPRYTDAALDAGTTYYYRVAAVVGGDVAHSDVVSATTTVDTPAAPVLTSATGSATSVDLAWSDVEGESGYQIERSPDGTSGWTDIGTTGQGVTSYTDTGLAVTTTYYYRVVAVGSNGESSPPSNMLPATTGPGQSSGGPSTSDANPAPSVAPTGP